MKANEKVGEYIPDNLIFDTKHPVDVATVTLAQGQGVLKRGSVITEEGTLWADDDTPKGILTDDTDTTGGETVTTVYRTGHFNRNALIITDDADVSAALETALVGIGIYLSNEA